MADRNDLEFTYSLIDRMFRLSLGEMADFSGAKYDGDFSLTLEEAQRAQARLSSPSRSGSGRAGGCSTSAAGGDRCSTSFGDAAASGVGVTLSSAQVAACRRTRTRRAPLRRAAARPRDLRSVRRGGEPRRVRALLLTRGVRRRAAGRDLPRSLRPRRERAARRGTLLPPDDGVRTEHDPARRRRHRRPARIRRVVPRAAGSPVPRLVASASDRSRSSRARSRTSAWCRARAAGSTTSRPSVSGVCGSGCRA